MVTEFNRFNVNSCLVLSLTKEVRDNVPIGVVSNVEVSIRTRRSRPGSRQDGRSGFKSGTRTQPEHQAIGFIARDRWTQLNCSRATGKFELGPRPVATSKLSVPNGAGEARAPSVISSIDRRARVGSAGMNPLPRVREAHRFKVVLR